MTFGARSTGRMRIRPEDHLVLDHAKLTGEDFSGRKLLQLSVAGSRLVGCSFSKIRARSASLGEGREMSHYIDCTFDGSRLALRAGGFARFERCSFRDVDLRDWFCFAVELVDCTFTGRLRKAIFNGTVPAEQRSMAGRISNDFRGNDFSGMDLRDVGFRTGLDLTLQRLPTGSQYLYVEDATGAVHRARNAVAHWEDLALRREAMVLIEILESEISEGQRQLLLRKDDYSSFPGEAIDALFGLLGGG